MTALPPDVVADLSRLVAELEQRLEQSFAAHDKRSPDRPPPRRKTPGCVINWPRPKSARPPAPRSCVRFPACRAMPSDRCRKLPRSPRACLAPPACGSGWSRTVNGAARFTSAAVQRPLPPAFPRQRSKIGGRNLPGTVVAENRQIHIPDLDNIAPEMADWPGLPPARAAGARTVSGTPLRRDGNAIGVLLIHRDHLQPFSEANWPCNRISQIRLPSRWRIPGCSTKPGRRWSVRPRPPIS